MPSINFYEEGVTTLSGGTPPPDFFDAGAMRTITFTDHLGNETTVSGGVFLGSESHLVGVDQTVYATASPSVISNVGPGLQSQITITFTESISDFSVTVFNGLSTSAMYQISDDKKDTEIITLGPNTDSSTDSQNVSLSNTNGINQVTITAIGASWDFSIDNIVYDFSVGDAQRLQNAGLPADFSALISNVILFSEVADLLSPSTISNFLFTLQFSVLYLTSLGEAMFSGPIGARTDSGAANTFDLNYKLPYTPTFVQLPTISPDSTITQQAANDANAAQSDLSKAVAYVQALDVTVNRLDSAMQASDQASVALQNASLDTFLSLSSSSVTAVVQDLHTVYQDVIGLNLNLPTVTTQEINNFLNNIQLHGFAGLPQQEQNLFNLFGLSPTDEHNVVNELLSASPLSVPTSLTTALQGLKTSVLDVANIYSGSPTITNGLLSVLSLDHQMELIYIGYFDRSADAGGFNFWEGQNATAQAHGQSAAVSLTNIANSFAPQAETEAIYPFLSNPHPNFSDPTVQAGLATFIGNVYENLFDRAGDSGGVGYWTGQIESGTVGLGAAVLAIANGAIGSDATVLENKIMVALDFTNLTGAANLGTTLATPALVAEAKTVLAGVDGLSFDDASVTTAEALIQPWIASHPNGALVAVVGSAAHFELT
jgi:hypothetical protein